MFLDGLRFDSQCEEVERFLIKALWINQIFNQVMDLGLRNNLFDVDQIIPVFAPNLIPVLLNYFYIYYPWWNKVLWKMFRV